MLTRSGIARYTQPLQPEQNVDAPRAALERLAPTRAERSAKAPTDRERGLLDAVEVLFGNGNWRERRIAYMKAMGDLHGRHPDDVEIAALYAVALLSGGRALEDRSLAYEMRAGALALRVLRSHSDHPGAAHYAIHAFDDPIHAPLALDAARRYARIAGDVSHARHMPSHIFLQHGLWAEVSAANEAAFEIAETVWRNGDSLEDMAHALERMPNRTQSLVGLARAAVATEDRSTPFENYSTLQPAPSPFVSAARPIPRRTRPSRPRPSRSG